MYGKRVLAERYTLVKCPVPLVPLVWVLRGSWLGKSLRFLYRKSPWVTYEKVSKTATSIVVTTIVYTLGLPHFSNLTKCLPWSKIEMPLLVT